MQTTTEFTWMLGAFAFLMAASSGTLISDVSLVWAAGMIFQIPYNMATAMAGGFPFFAPVFILGFLFFFGTLIKGAVGEGLQMFILFAFIAMILHV